MMDDGQLHTRTVSRRSSSVESRQLKYVVDNSPEAWVRAVTRMLLRLTLYTLLLIGVVYAIGRLRPIITAVIVATILAYVIRPLAGKLLDYGWFVRPHEWVFGLIRSAGVSIL